MSEHLRQRWGALVREAWGNGEVDYGGDPHPMKWYDTNLRKGDRGVYCRQDDLEAAGMPKGQRFDNPDHVRAYVRPHLPPGFEIVVRFRDDMHGEAATALRKDQQGVLMMFGPTMRWERVVLHELAHALNRLKKGKAVASHGKDWAKEFADLLWSQMGLGFPNFGVAAAATRRLRMWRSDKLSMTYCTRCMKTWRAEMLPEEQGDIDSFRPIYSDDPSIGPGSIEVCSYCGKTIVNSLPKDEWGVRGSKTATSAEFLAKQTDAELVDEIELQGEWLERLLERHPDMRGKRWPRYQGMGSSYMAHEGIGYYGYLGTILEYEGEMRRRGLTPPPRAKLIDADGSEV